MENIFDSITVWINVPQENIFILFLPCDGKQRKLIDPKLVTFFNLCLFVTYLAIFYWPSVQVILPFRCNICLLASTKSGVAPSCRSYGETCLLLWPMCRANLWHVEVFMTTLCGLTFCGGSRLLIFARFFSD